MSCLRDFGLSGKIEGLAQGVASRAHIRSEDTIVRCAVRVIVGIIYRAAEISEGPLKTRVPLEVSLASDKLRGAL